MNSTYVSYSFSLKNILMNIIHSLYHIHQLKRIELNGISSYQSRTGSAKINERTHQLFDGTPLMVRVLRNLFSKYL